MDGVMSHMIELMLLVMIMLFAFAGAFSVMFGWNIEPLINLSDGEPTSSTDISQYDSAYYDFVMEYNALNINKGEILNCRVVPEDEFNFMTYNHTALSTVISERRELGCFINESSLDSNSSFINIFQVVKHEIGLEGI